MDDPLYEKLHALEDDRSNRDEDSDRTIDSLELGEFIESLEGSDVEIQDDEYCLPANTSDLTPRLHNTGPKGVLEEYKIHQKGQRRENALKTRMVWDMAKKNSLALNKSFGETEKDLEEISKIREKRLRELKQTKVFKRKFGHLYIVEMHQFLREIENEQNAVPIIFISNVISDDCQALNEYMKSLSRKYPFAKFLTMEASQLSDKFDIDVVPILQVYYSGNLSHNFVRLVDYLGENFTSWDLEIFLRKYEILTSNHEGEFDSDIEQEVSDSE
ncbi:thioredoxin-like protein [Rozella allomycis CSF55]|uniref:Thioredoxin-like fold domain-containing protein n=1 Tax=Rozella allomycis (strain CSF55) TaxID=988480 RepID=A0A075B3U5_ROZAC|nr:Thioredoxin-like fold domain-containing protein [Rozella allomycis CSF55]RKP21364.1 thioredoxin-like protein [Rozella allomycis CSF55]|eukprot:EPZ35787.1 Thioredoxin-like fold domain-containing protein [Rozella allomycis CSF55]